MAQISFPSDDNITYLFLDWGELGALTQVLATKILDSGAAPYDRIIALATGGQTMSKAIKDYLNIQNSSSMHISFYTGIGTTNKTPVITQSIATDLQGERVLVFDDVNDTGATLEVAKAYLQMRGVKSIDTACLLQKPRTKCPSTFFGDSTESWIIFPDEVRETITLLSSRWSKQGVSKQDIHSRLNQIGFLDSHLTLIENYS
ncbi:MAG: phosphoribosyltransferase family protein [bacterium]